MKKYLLYQVDSFTKELFTGNPAGVVSNADGLDEISMQKIAREMNNSETAFIFSGNDDFDVHVRFFTPTNEVPICGHATIAAHYVRAKELSLKNNTIIRQKTGAGILPVTILNDGSDYQIVMEQGKISVENIADTAQIQILDALGLSIDDKNENCPISIASTGHSKVMIGINDLSKLHELNPNLQKLTEISYEINCNGYYVFVMNPGEKYLIHGRMFAPAIGIAEDPVTGNANGPLGAYLCHYGLIDTRDKEKISFLAVQGEKINRRGTMRVEVSLQDEIPTKVKIIGDAKIVFKTSIEI